MVLGDLIKNYRQENKMSMRDFAKKCNLSFTYISALEKNKDYKTGKSISPTLETVKSVANAINMPIEDLLQELDEDQKFTITSNKDKNINIPILGIVKAGYDYLANENWQGMIEVDSDFAKGKDLFALKVTGDSMFPVLIEDDIVVINKQSNFENGDIVVALVGENEATIKKAKKTDSAIILQPLNNNYDPLIFTNEDIKNLPVEIIGVVKELKRRF